MSGITGQNKQLVLTETWNRATCTCVSHATHCPKACVLGVLLRAGHWADWLVLRKILLARFDYREERFYFK